MIVEQQQIASIVDRRARMLRDQRRAGTAALGRVVGRHYAQRRSAATCGVGISRQIGRCHVERDYRHIDRLRYTIDAKCCIAAMSEQILQLNGTTVRYAALRQLVVELPAGADQRRAHEHLAHDSINVWRMYAVTAKVAGAPYP